MGNYAAKWRPCRPSTVLQAANLIIGTQSRRLGTIPACVAAVGQAKWAVSVRRVSAPEAIAAQDAGRVGVAVPGHQHQLVAQLRHLLRAGPTSLRVLC